MRHAFVDHYTDEDSKTRFRYAVEYETDGSAGGVSAEESVVWCADVTVPGGSVFFVGEIARNISGLVPEQAVAATVRCSIDRMLR